MNEKLEKFMEKKSGSGDYKVGRGVRVEGTGIAEEEGQDHRETVWKYPGSGMGNILPIFTFQINIFFLHTTKLIIKATLKNLYNSTFLPRNNAFPAQKDGNLITILFWALGHLKSYASSTGLCLLLPLSTTWHPCHIISSFLSFFLKP